ncbi:MAG TPA: CoA pyrophosphatase [Alphaproteobacteria bacterium]|nr:CoA pyrophosphatase [Alphaproteobacteria bacterium]HAJ46211.1 CoA pyrophosphatase [Alphaproteobacteria bacterium]
MTLDDLRRVLKHRFPERLASQPPVMGDHDLNPDWQAERLRQTEGDRPALRDAAVLIPLVARPHGIQVLLTRRSADLPSHAGQVSFPGGKVQPGDLDFADTALRETEEEVGLARRYVEIAGHLDPYETGTGFAIRPVVGLVAEGFDLTIDAREVAEAFEVPFSFLMNPENHQRHHAVWQGRRRSYFAIPYGRHYIWGATAGMLVALQRRLFTEASE